MTIEARFLVRRRTFVLDVDLSIHSQGVTALFGPSGCGKTTLLRAISGLERHREGSLKVNDMIWQDSNRFIPTHRRSIGYVFQEASLFTHLTVQRNLEYGFKRVPRGEHRISLNDAIELLSIGHLLHHKPNTLSGGERQRVAIARALAVSPRLLLMDEPLAALDWEGKQEILSCLESLHDELKIPVLYVSHTIEEIARLADHLILLKAGHVVATGAVSEMWNRLDLPSAYRSREIVMNDTVLAGYNEKYRTTHYKS